MVQTIEVPMRSMIAEKDVPPIITVPRQPVKEVYIEACGQQGEWDQMTQWEMWDAIKGHADALEGVKPYKGAYPTRPDAWKWAFMMPEEDARELVRRMDSAETTDMYEREHLDVFTWIEEDVHSTTAIAINVPTQGNIYTAARTAQDFKELIERKAGRSLSIAPGRWFETRKPQYLAKRMFFHVMGLTPSDVGRLMGEDDLVTEITQKSILIYDHSGITVGTLIAIAVDDTGV